MEEGKPRWLEHIHRQIKRREQTDVIPFRQVIAAYLEAIHREEALLDDLETVRDHESSLENQLRTMETDLAAFTSGGGMDKRKFTELQSKYDEMKEEQNKLFRQQSSYAQRLLDLNEQLKAKDQVTGELQAQLDRAHAYHSSLQQCIEEMHGTVDEKNLNIQIMQDELTALQLELLHTDDRMAKLEEENKRLVDKWMAKVSETADILNDQIAGPLTKMAGSMAVTGPTSHCPSSVALSFNVEGKKELINTMIIDPAGEHFAVCTTYPAVPIYLFSDSKKHRYLWGGPKTGIVSGCFNTSGDLFVGTTVSTGSSNPSIYVWHEPSEKIRVCLSGHDGIVTGAAFLRGDDTKIVSCSHDHTLRIYDLPRSLCLRTVEAKSAINAVLTGAFGILTAHQDGSLCLWDERSGAIQATSSALHSRSILSAVYVPVSNEIITVSLDHTIKSVDLNSLSSTQTFKHDSFRVPSEGGLPSISPDGKYLVGGSSNGSLYVWNRAWNSELETILTGHFSSVVATIWSPKSNLLASADRNGCIKVWK